jgi:alpha-1,2-mannosyltransferase
MLTLAPSSAPQAAGLIPLAHASAGPWLDIIAPYPLPAAYKPALDAPPPLSTRTGWHAKTPREFSASLVEILELSPAERETIRRRAKASVSERFGRDAFEKGWGESLQRLLARLESA